MLSATTICVYNFYYGHKRATIESNKNEKPHLFTLPTGCNYSGTDVIIGQGDIVWNSVATEWVEIMEKNKTPSGDLMFLIMVYGMPHWVHKHAVWSKEQLDDLRKRYEECIYDHTDYEV